ncbi:MAG: hypothetical protein CMK07_01960 [Ponticaulis sp.]|nr:hypothetical protein [Ponticaulis sp.]
MLIMILGLAACGGSETEEPEIEVTPVEVAERPVLISPERSQPAKATDPLVEDDVIIRTPVSIFGLETPFVASGTEPFWKAEFAEGWIVFDRPGLPLVEVPLPELPEGGSGSMMFDAEALTVSLSRTGCEGGAIAVTIEFEDIHYDGCTGERTNDAPVMADDVMWEGLIESYLPAIDACLAQAEGGRLIRALYPREENTVGMILMDDVGRFEECGANSQSGQISFFDPIMPDQAAIWFDGPAVFARSGGSPACVSANAELDIDVGADVGTLYPAGCR